MIIRCFFLLLLSYFWTVDVHAESGDRYRLDVLTAQVTFDADSTLHPFHGHAVEVKSDEVVFDRVHKTLLAPAEVHIPAFSLNTGNSRRDKAMRTMLSATIYPEILWRAESMSCKATNAAKRWICVQEGTLKVKDVAHQYTLPLNLEEDDSGGFSTDGDLTINLDDFKLKPPSVLGLIKVDKWIQIHFKTRWKPT